MSLGRRDLFKAAALAAFSPRPGEAVQFPEHLELSLMAAPDDPTQWPAYRQALVAWRRQTKERLKYDDSLYRREDFAWVTSSFACCFLMMCDEMFYDRAKAGYQVDAWLDHGIREFGGYDSIVLWHAYPRIGLDERNQFDFYRDMPGGLGGLSKLVSRFHERGVKVYIDYNPWDTGTRREGLPDIDALPRLVGSIGADGIFLDTMNRGAAEFREKLDRVRPGVVLESEGALPLENVREHHMSWAQGFADSLAPGVLRNKWFERRHMQHQIKRWNRDHSGELHSAWMNGSGMMVWENVFGSWVGWSARDKSILRAILPVQRRYARLFSGEGWTPLVPCTMPDVYASLWEDASTRLWTLVNRSERERKGTVLQAPHREGEQYFDLIRGRSVKPSIQDGVTSFDGAIRPRGVACYLAAPEAALGSDFPRFLAEQARTHARSDFRADFPGRKASLRPPPLPKSRPAREPENMVAAGPATVDMVVEYRVREPGFYGSQEYAVERGFRPLHRLAHVRRTVRLRRYAIDLTPVTNAQYQKFLLDTGYSPVHTENYLKHWMGAAPPTGMEDHPVVYVDLEDARAYAAWAGKRLPLEEEWQYAAQGPDGLRYPWGNEWVQGRCNGGETGGTTPVTAYPGGRSPLGCYDMCGNTWEWTESERSDGRTRFCILRGGSFFKAEGSHWYMDGGPQPGNFGAKFLLMWPGLDRCGSIGFRCAVELA